MIESPQVLLSNLFLGLTGEPSQDAGAGGEFAQLLDLQLDRVAVAESKAMTEEEISDNSLAQSWWTGNGGGLPGPVPAAPLPEPAGDELPQAGNFLPQGAGQGVANTGRAESQASALLGSEQPSQVPDDTLAPPFSAEALRPLTGDSPLAEPMVQGAWQKKVFDSPPHPRPEPPQEEGMTAPGARLEPLAEGKAQSSLANSLIEAATLVVGAGRPGPAGRAPGVHQIPTVPIPAKSLPVESLPVKSLAVKSLPVESQPVESPPIESMAGGASVSDDTPSPVQVSRPLVASDLGPWMERASVIGSLTGLSPGLAQPASTPPEAATVPSPREDEQDMIGAPSPELDMSLESTGKLVRDEKAFADQQAMSGEPAVGTRHVPAASSASDRQEPAFARPQPFTSAPERMPSGVTGSGDAFASGLSLTLATPMGHGRWGEAFSSQIVRMARQDMQQAQIQLDPVELGPIDIQLSMSGGELSVAFQAQHATTREALEQSLPRLREMLSEAGMQLGNVDVSGQPDRGQQRAFAAAAGESSPYRQLRDAPPSDESFGKPRGKPAAEPGRIDYFA